MKREMNIIKLHRGANIGTLVCAALVMLYSFGMPRLPWTKVYFLILAGIGVSCALIALLTLKASCSAVDKEIQERGRTPNANRL